MDSILPLQRSAYHKLKMTLKSDTLPSGSAYLPARTALMTMTYLHATLPTNRCHYPSPHPATWHTGGAPIPPGAPSDLLCAALSTVHSALSLGSTVPLSPPLWAGAGAPRQVPHWAPRQAPHQAPRQTTQHYLITRQDLTRLDKT